MEIKVKDYGYTPMINQFLEIKEKYPNILIFFRLGDFYELFFEDAEIASKELQLYLTHKSAGNNRKIKMCGVPHHAYKSYLQKLIDKGYKVGIVEQLENPQDSKNKLVKRDVVQIITPGANIDKNDTANNFIAGIELFNDIAVISYLDISTGEVFVSNLLNNPSEIASFLINKDVKEVVVVSNFNANIISYIKSLSENIVFSFHNEDETKIECEFIFQYINDDRQIRSLSRLLNYVLFTQKRDVSYYKSAEVIVLKDTLKMNYQAKLNLELVQTLDNRKTQGSLYWFLNETSTSMGGRLLKRMIDEPSADIHLINKRLDSVEEFNDNFIIRENIISLFKSIYDIDRLLGRIGFKNCNGHDLIQLKKSLSIIPKLRTCLKKFNSNLLKQSFVLLKDFDKLIEVLDRALVENPPITVTEGGMINVGYDEELDELINIQSHFKEWIATLENNERERTGIKNLKVGYTKVFGYYIEISNTNLSLVKDEFGYERKQTLSTGERFVTKELKEKEDKIIHAEELRKSREYLLFCQLRDMIKESITDIQKLSETISLIDVLTTFSKLSCDYNFVRPNFNQKNIIDVKESWHPILTKSNKNISFVKNDFYMDSKTEVVLITGPNMGGKSTYMRQLAISVVLAQIGMFVPATEYNCPIFTSIYTRIGATDDIRKGQSTFMVEMSEVREALENANQNSLLIFDEIGRGTATFDGMALAQAVLEFLVSKVHAKVLFSTHYHELTDFVKNINAIKNVNASVKELDDDIVFLYKIVEGTMDKSYGLHVAKLAGLNEEIVARASQLLTVLESQNSLDKDNINKQFNSLLESQKVNLKKKSDFENIIEKIKQIDPLNLSPMEALNYVFELNKMVKENGK